MKGYKESKRYENQTYSSHSKKSSVLSGRYYLGKSKWVQSNSSLVSPKSVLSPKSILSPKSNYSRTSIN